ncbi:phage head-tail connector protein [Priestia filamentosa]|uniref:phage head-tail connector protein n=1 Tax=Priestia filamentosa TaxID=1402861 RepID=UPI000A08E339|nr:phage head-tail connector protein [Priestia filamentosa]OXS69842.1 hypothetical protein B1B01_12890 [Priestia filamentosa]SMF36756.1 Phage gp6-like head-tail connector protein [Priestia filamentosa]
MALLDAVKVYLGIEDKLQDALLSTIIQDQSVRVQQYIGEDNVPSELSWIVKELSVIRFNRIGSEGTSSDSEEGRSASYIEDPFQSFIPHLDRYLEKQQRPVSKGKAKFL